MTDKEGKTLLTMLAMNYNTFMPTTKEGVMMKTGMWMAEFAKVPFEAGYRAITKVIAENTFPPTIAHFKTALGDIPLSPEMTRNDLQARLPGPTFDSVEGMRALYTADMTRVDALMSALDRELARGGRDAEER